MKKTLFILISCATLLTACGGSSSSSDTTDASAPATTQVPDTTTTTVAADPPECSLYTIGQAAGEGTTVFTCVDDWASVQPASYADCTECESVWLYKWEQGQWVVKARCNQFMSMEEGCAGYAGTANNWEYTYEPVDLPPLEVRCRLYFSAEPGCPPS